MRRTLALVALLLPGCAYQLFTEAQDAAEQALAAAKACPNPAIQTDVRNLQNAQAQLATAQAGHDAALARADEARGEASRLRQEAEALDYRARQAHSRKLELESQRDAAGKACNEAGCRDPECGRVSDAPACRRWVQIVDEQDSLPSADEIDQMRAEAARMSQRAEEMLGSDGVVQAELNNAASWGRSASSYAQNVANLATALQERIFEECTGTADAGPNPAPAPLGGYNQDIFGTQNLGMPGTSLGACPVGSPMQTSCLVIQFMCNASCTPGGGSCSPGAPAGCLACYAAGCI